MGLQTGLLVVGAYGGWEILVVLADRGGVVGALAMFAASCLLS